MRTMQWTVLAVLLCSSIATSSCAPTSGGTNSRGFVRGACGPAGGNALSITLTDQAVACDAAEPRGSILLYPVSTGSTSTISGRRCLDGVCASVTSGTLDVQHVTGTDSYDVTWSLSFSDGTSDSGHAILPWCGGVPFGCI